MITADAIKTKLMDLEEDSGNVIGAFTSFRKNKIGSTGTKTMDIRQSQNRK